MSTWSETVAVTGDVREEVEVDCDCGVVWDGNPAHSITHSSQLFNAHNIDLMVDVAVAHQNETVYNNNNNINYNNE